MKSVDVSAKVQTADIVVMGSSRAHHHYVPSVIKEITGYSAHNAGVDGNGIVLATGIFNMMTKRYQPRMIIYDVTPAFDINVYAEDGNDTRYLGWLRPYYNDPEVRKTIIQVSRMERYKNYSSMFRYNSKIVDLLKDQIVIGDFTTDGYAPLSGTMMAEPKVKKSISPSQTDSIKMNMMEDFIKDNLNSNVKLVFVASPKYGAESSSVFEPLNELCELYGVEFWDYYTDPRFQKMEYFKESMHLNCNGAIVFSTEIANRILQK